MVAGGGIGDGRGVAAALALGAQGACLGTRFLATTEMTIDRAWKDRIVAARVEDAVKVENAARVMPPFTVPQTGRPYAPRSLRTPLTEQLERDQESIDPNILRRQLLEAVRSSGGGHDLLPFAGQSVALVHDVLPATELFARLVTETEEALRNASAAIRP